MADGGRASPSEEDTQPSATPFDSAAAAPRDTSEGGISDPRNTLSPLESPRRSASFPQAAIAAPSASSPASSPSLAGSQRDSTPLQRPVSGPSSDLSGALGPTAERLQRQSERLSATGEASPLPGFSRARQRIRAPTDSLPAAFPPPSRARRAGPASLASGGDADEGSSTSSQTSPKVNQSRVAGGGLGAQELGVEANGADELELSVPSHQEHLTSDGQRASLVRGLPDRDSDSRYTTYEVVVRMGGRQWSVRKRYSQFDQFRMSLRKQHKEVGSFRFPNKSKFNTFSEHTKERRRTGFDEFLRLVAGLHPRPQEVDVFLAMDEHGAGVRGRSGSRQLAWTSRNVSPVEPPAGPALGRVWAENAHTGPGRRLPPGSAIGGPPKGGASHRVPRFPPLADQGRSEKAAEAAAAAAASASRNSASSLVRQVDLMLRRLLGPDLLSMLCVVAVSAVSIVGVWKVGGRPGIATLVMGVCVGLFIQNWDRGLDLLNFVLELAGMSPESAHPPSPNRRSQTSSHDERPRAESAAAWLGRARQPQPVRNSGRQ